MKCLCFQCTISQKRLRRNIAATTTFKSLINPTHANISKNSTRPPVDLRRRYLLVFLVGGISVAAFVFNLIVMIKLVCSPLTVIDLFGMALMLFNVILSFYGFSMAYYILRPMKAPANEKYCQFFTSIKLFALGASVYTLTLLVFHHPIRRSVDDNIERGGEKEEKENETKKRDAIFKGIVFILEGVMLSGVLGVLSWIKFKDWLHLCAIIDPVGSVENLLFGIEMWYYVLCGLLIVWYVGNYFYRQYLIIENFRINLKRKKNGEEEEEMKYVTPYICRDFPIFVMVVLSFILWIGGFVVIKPSYNLFSPDNAAVIRICSTLIPLIVQPVIYIIRNTCCCRICPNKSDKASISDEMKLECKCSGECNCNSGDLDEFSQSKNNNVQMTKFGSTRWSKISEDDHHQSDEEDDMDDEKTALNKKDRTTTFEIPKVVCRSPNSGSFRETPDEETRLLDDVDAAKKPQTPTTPTIIIEDETVHENKNLASIDESEEGRTSRGPTFYPIAKKETEVLPAEIKLKTAKTNLDNESSKINEEDELNEHNHNDCENEALLANSASSPTLDDEKKSSTSLNNTHDASNHKDVYNKIQTHPSPGDANINSNHTNNKISKRPLLSGGQDVEAETIER